MLGFGTFLLDIRDLSDLRPNYYYLDTEIYKTLPNWSLLVPPAATSAEAAISGEVWAATLANFTHSDAESTNIRPIIREEGESQDEWNHRNLHPEDHWTSENPCVVERLQKSFKQVLDGDGRWPGRVAEVECHQQYCEVPLGKSTIKFIFDPCLSLDEVGNFYTAQHNKEPPSTEGLYPDDDDLFED
ncbi:hypothetical protein TREMEDRAFT_62630 [Tremella mesenterica DSM 1558]|uniref:uncharacterized protein n=1 Tax=Tremella mesenterica (strain ATCC 24925 / CBS 8224 / DSM 1558 / NBRC 9311 / NRRL Y-6157 / RJB 2259-6 / UBC 559-6) TaxID=578456 RepID=UPI0003F49141|nr:uncharacterized protein TREMEDRAFT_62630 [Tremella mesenterica DSM 1558]EIW68912.1 hypothetical protein TREMEDRAFT_62630 [Tremella mesenterica DSM 1558]